jgi:hypothetical protein
VSYRGIVTQTTRSKTELKTIAAAVALGAAAVFLPQWDPDDHWSTPDAPHVVVVDQLDDDDWVNAPPHRGRLSDGRGWASLG